MTTGNIAKAIAECAVKIGRVQKAGENKAQGFKFVGDEHIMEKAQAALSECELSISPAGVRDISRVRQELEGRNGKRYENQVTLLITWRVCHSSGESITCETVGTGFDGGDKADYKAMTGARKYLFRLLFHIPTGDDPDRDTPESDTEAHANSAKRSAPTQQAADPETEARRNVFTFVSGNVGAGIAGTGTTFHTFCRSAPVDRVRAFGNKFREINVGSMQAQDAFLQCVAEFVTAP
jgi:hypothetical protein